MYIKNIEKEFEKAKIKKCNICGKEITIDDIRVNKVIMTISKRKTCNMAHKVCLLGR